MINIEGYNIEYLEELKEGFQLDKVFPLIKAIIMTDEMFDFEGGDKFQNALRYTFESSQESFSVKVNDEGGIGVIIDEKLFPVRHTPAENFTDITVLSRKETLALILCDLVEREYKTDKESTTQACSDSFCGEIKSGTIKRAKVKIPVPNLQEQLSLGEISNISASGFAYVILEDDSNHTLNYQLNAGNRMFVLLIGNCPVNKIPQFSVGSTHVNYIQYIGKSEVKVSCKDFNSGNTSVKHVFDARKLTQVCADEKSGFIALIDGEIVSYSDEIQPEDIEDLMAYIPKNEKILMIQLRNRQLFALTNEKRVYSNYKVNTDRDRAIIWMSKAPDGEIKYTYADEFVFPSDSDSQSVGKITVNYNNGKISK
ncbi:MAG: hypothetical protein K2K26_12255 [Muribaculaceae bacterium]|nr:hypothetical protein [Muribaculaceae bacterium]